MPLENLIKQEETWNNNFTKHEFKFEVKKLLSVTVLRCRDVSVSFVSDKIDTPDPQFRVTVPSFPEPNSFRTLTKQNQPTSEINETFNFVFPPESSLKEPRLVKIELHDDDIVWDDYLGEESFDFSKFELGKSYAMTLSFNGHGEVDIEAKITTRSKPDFRLGLNLHEEERKFRIRRIPKVYEALKNLIGPDAPRDVEETPIISLCTSGGGYRATVGMTGVMEALRDHNLLDIFTYAAGLSGSGWYLESAYARKGFKKNEQENFHKFMKSAATDSFLSNAFSLSNVASFRKYIKAKKRSGQPTSFVDLFGFTAGSLFLGVEKLDRRMSDIKDYIEDASVPFPLLVSLHVKNNASASKFHAYMECSPHECAFPAYGIGFEPGNFGSVWNSGFIARSYAEAPTHFHMGVTASVFAISATSNMESGEKEERLLSYIDKIRTEKRREKDEFEGDESDDDEDEDETDTMATEPSSFKDRLGSYLQSFTNIFHRDEQSSSNKNDHEDNRDGGRKENHGVEHEKVDEDNPESLRDKFMFVRLIMQTFVKTRDSLLGRTGKLFNFSKNFENLETFYFSPWERSLCLGPEKEELMNLIEGKAKQKMSTTKKTISLVDAGLYNNTPSVILLRPQRATDLLIVMDFSSHPSDDAFYNIELFGTAAHAWREGLKFPPVDFKKIHNLPPTECLVFDDQDDDTCPVVVWFSFSTLKFRQLKDFKPRSGFKYDKELDKENSKFNDFTLFGPKGNFGVYKLGYSELDYERINELMYFNVSSNIEVIREAIVKAVAKKRRRLQRNGSSV